MLPKKSSDPFKEIFHKPEIDGVEEVRLWNVTYLDQGKCPEAIIETLETNECQVRYGREVAGAVVLCDLLLIY